jgi:hypothetical protein
MFSIDPELWRMFRLFLLPVAVVAAVWTHWDASSLRNRGAKVTPMLWGILTFFLLPLAVPAYLILRATVWQKQLLPKAPEPEGRKAFKKPVIHQLVGEVCLVCRRRIGTMAEAKLCPECGCAVHHSCFRPGAPTTDTALCAGCGGDPTTRSAPSYRG